MPIPSKKEGEKPNDFMSRCMTDDKMKEEYPANKQRTAVCLSKAGESLDYMEAADFNFSYEAYGFEEQLNENNIVIPKEEDYIDAGEKVEDWSFPVDYASLWENIRKKKEREGKKYKPAKPGDPDRPDPEAWKKAKSKEVSKDVFDNPGEAMERAKELGLDGIHDHPSKKEKGKKVYMPGKTHEEYEKKLREEMSKADKPGKNDPRRTPAPKKDQKKGSKKNKPDSAKDDKGKITFSKEVTQQLSNKVKEHNDKGKGSKATLGMLKSVYRRGSGAYSTSHAPKMSRHGWAIARVNAFLTLLRTGKPSNSGYTQDNDLLPKGHPRSAKASAKKAGPMEDYIFVSKDEAMKMAEKLGMDGVHTSTTKDGTTLYIPGKTDQEFFNWYRKNDGTDASAEFKYKDPKTGEVYEYERKGIYKKNGRTLIPVRAAKYQGRTVKLNKPFRTPDGPKKFSVYVKNEKGNVVKVNFGDPNMEIKKDDPARRKSFRARHKCDTPGPKWKARYWSCKNW